MELLLVLAVLAIVMAIAMPTYQGMIVSARLQQSAEKLELEMKRARVAAIRTGQAQVFRFQIGGGAYDPKLGLGRRFIERVRWCNGPERGRHAGEDRLRW